MEFEPYNDKNIESYGAKQITHANSFSPQNNSMGSVLSCCILWIGNQGFQRMDIELEVTKLVFDSRPVCPESPCSMTLQSDIRTGVVGKYKRV